MPTVFVQKPQKRKKCPNEYHFEPQAMLRKFIYHLHFTRSLKCVYGSYKNLSV